jgi:hypothetical protein
MAWQYMAHTGPLPPIWVLLDLQPTAETLHHLSLVEFTTSSMDARRMLLCGMPS